MGLLNIPAPLWQGIDALLASFLPAWARLIFWAAFAATMTMSLYRLLSPQKRIGVAKREARAARAALNAYDGDMAGAMPLMRRQFATALRHVGLVLPASLLALLPLLSLLIWAETWYGHALPDPAQSPPVQLTPDGGFSAQWRAANGAASLRITRGNEPLTTIAYTAPVPVVHQHQWWNWLAGNPLGYLPDDSALQQVRVELPERHYIPWGPNWLGSWLALFIPVLFGVSLTIHRFFKIE